MKYYKCSCKIDDHECGWQPEYNFAKNKTREWVKQHPVIPRALEYAVIEYQFELDWKPLESGRFAILLRVPFPFVNL